MSFCSVPNLWKASCLRRKRSLLDEILLLCCCNFWFHSNGDLERPGSNFVQIQTVDQSIDADNSEKHKWTEGRGSMQCTVVVAHQHTFCNLYTLVMLPLRHAASLLPPSLFPSVLLDLTILTIFQTSHSTPTFPPLSLYHMILGSADNSATLTVHIFMSSLFLYTAVDQQCWPRLISTTPARMIALCQIFLAVLATNT